MTEDLWLWREGLEVDVSWRRIDGLGLSGSGLEYRPQRKRSECNPSFKQ